MFTNGNYANLEPLTKRETKINITVDLNVQLIYNID